MRQFIVTILLALGLCSTASADVIKTQVNTGLDVYTNTGSGYTLKWSLGANGSSTVGPSAFLGTGANAYNKINGAIMTEYDSTHRGNIASPYLMRLSVNGYFDGGNIFRNSNTYLAGVDSYTYVQIGTKVSSGNAFSVNTNNTDAQGVADGTATLTNAKNILAGTHDGAWTLGSSVTPATGVMPNNTLYGSGLFLRSNATAIGSGGPALTNTLAIMMSNRANAAKWQLGLSELAANGGSEASPAVYWYSNDASAYVGTIAPSGAWTFPINTSHNFGTSATNAQTSLSLRGAGSTAYMGIEYGDTLWTPAADGDLAILQPTGKALNFGIVGGSANLGSASSAGAWTLGPATGSAAVTHRFQAGASTGANTIVRAQSNTSDNFAGFFVGQNADTTGMAGLVWDRNQARNYLYYSNSYGLRFASTTTDALTSPISGVAGFTETGSVIAGAWTFGAATGTSGHLMRSVTTGPNLDVATTGGSTTSIRVTGTATGSANHAILDLYSGAGGSRVYATGLGTMGFYAGASQITNYDTTDPTLVGGYDASGAWTLGASGTSAGHLLQGTVASSHVVRILNAHASTQEGALTVAKGRNDGATSNGLVNFYVNTTTLAGYIVANSGTPTFAAAISDRRLKDDITTLEPQLRNVLALRPVTFKFKETHEASMGFVAQEMQQVYPDSVFTKSDGYLSIAGWDRTSARLVKAIQDQHVIIQCLANADTKEQRLACF